MKADTFPTETEKARWREHARRAFDLLSQRPDWIGVTGLAAMSGALNPYDAIYRLRRYGVEIDSRRTPHGAEYRLAR